MRVRLGAAAPLIGLLLIASPAGAAQAPVGSQQSAVGGQSAVDSRQSSGGRSTTSTQPSISGLQSLFLGGVPTGTATADAPVITILDAMQRALQHNLGVLTAEEQLGRARGTRYKEMAALLPNINGRVAETRQEINLAAFGFGGPASPFFLVTGGNIPTIVGPFNVFDARVYLTQNVLDLNALNTTRAEEHNVAAAQHLYRGARGFVIWVAGDLYLQALAASARADAAKAQQDTAQALYNQAVDLRQGGLIAGLDVLRAEVQLNADKQRATSTANDFQKAKLVLARVMGLPLGQNYTLSVDLPRLPNPDMTVEQAVDQAYKTRADYQAALERVKAAESLHQAAVGEALPAIRVNADFGDIGLTPSDARTTFSVTGAVIIPVFQGGRTRARLAETDADVRSRRNEAEDLKGAIYYEVRAALLDLQATNEQLQVATRARDLAAQQLTQSRDRFAAGVASNIEVIQAQEAVAVANEQFISASYGYDLAKGALLRGIGTAEETLRQVLGGAR